MNKPAFYLSFFVFLYSFFNDGLLTTSVGFAICCYYYISGGFGKIIQFIKTRATQYINGKKKHAVSNSTGEL